LGRIREETDSYPRGRRGDSGGRDLQKTGSEIRVHRRAREKRYGRKKKKLGSEKKSRRNSRRSPLPELRTSRVNRGPPAVRKKLKKDQLDRSGKEQNGVSC